MRRAILAIALVLGLAGAAEANGGLFGFRARQRVVVRNNFVQPVVAVNAFHAPAIRVRSFAFSSYAPAAFIQPVYAQQFVAPVYSVQQFGAGYNCGGSVGFSAGYSSPFLRLNFGY